MIVHSVRLSIRGPLPEVFAAVAELDEHRATWARRVIAVTRDSSGATATGSHFTATTKVGPFRTLWRYSVLAYEKDAVFAGRAEARPLRLIEYYAFGPDVNGATRVDYSAEVVARGPLRIVERLLRRRVQAQLDGDLGEMVRVLEVQVRSVPRRDQE